MDVFNGGVYDFGFFCDDCYDCVSFYDSYVYMFYVYFSYGGSYYYDVINGFCVIYNCDVSSYGCVSDYCFSNYCNDCDC